MEEGILRESFYPYCLSELDVYILFSSSFQDTTEVSVTIFFRVPSQPERFSRRNALIVSLCIS